MRRSIIQSINLHSPPSSSDSQYYYSSLTLLIFCYIHIIWKDKQQQRLMMSSEHMMLEQLHICDESGLAGGSILSTIQEDETRDQSWNKPEVKQRVKALKKMQLEMTKMDIEFYQEVHALESKYLSKYLPFYEKRKNIILGEHELSVEECDFVGDSNSEVEANTEGEPMESKNISTEKVTGIPNFWLTIFQNVGIIEELVEEHDEPILKHLTDILVELTENPMGFTLVFHFSPNEYFTNSILTKSYEMNCSEAEDDPYLFEGPVITKCKGCPIDWVKGKDVTARKIKKKQKPNTCVKMAPRLVNAPSFFNFFNPPATTIDLPLDSDTYMRMVNDFVIGQYIRERIVPRAVLYYTGEALEDDDEEEVEEESEDEDNQLCLGGGICGLGFLDGSIS